MNVSIVSKKRKKKEIIKWNLRETNLFCRCVHIKNCTGSDQLLMFPIRDYFQDCCLKNNYDIKTCFESQFKNRSVTWTGTVLKVNPDWLQFSFDSPSSQHKNPHLYLHVKPETILKYKHQLTVGKTLPIRITLLAFGFSFVFFSVSNSLCSYFINFRLPFATIT